MPESTAVARCASEAIGTFVLVSAVVGNVLSGQDVWGGVSVGCSLMAMVYAFGNSSGAHLNPAVTVAALLCGKISARDAGGYCLSQVFAGSAAALVMSSVYGNASIDLAPTMGYSWLQAGVAECIFTTVLCFVVLSTTAAASGQFYGLAIGFAVVAGAYGAGSMSMGCFNPAVAWALDVTALVRNGTASLYSLVYIGFEIIGAAAGAGAFLLIHAGRGLCGQPPLRARLLSEFWGTYVLVVTVGLNLVTGSPAAVFSIGAALTCMVFSLGCVSGAHLNPAVTLAVLAARRGRISLKDACGYVLAQVAAGAAAALTVRALAPDGIAYIKPPQSTWQQVVAAEALFTFVLALVVLSVATVSAGRVLSEYFGLAIGMCVVVGGHSIGSISSASLNPAVSVGLAILGPPRLSWQCVPYVASELVAGLVAAQAFALTQPSEYSRAAGDADAKAVGAEDMAKAHDEDNTGGAAADVIDL